MMLYDRETERHTDRGAVHKVRHAIFG